jgi:hypothetical protein
MAAAAAGGASPVGWRRAIVLTHRWLGIALGLLLLVWFATGIVMMYARMPGLDPADRLRRLPDLDLSSVRVTPSRATEAIVAGEAAATPAAGAPIERVRIGMIGERPVYRFFAAGAWTTVFADDGGTLRRIDPDAALALARRHHVEHAATMRHERVLDGPDQWTLQSRTFLPLHRIALGDPLDTRVYLSDRTGEVVMATDRPSRRWAYVGAVPHWLYFAALRRHSTLWIRSMIGLSLAGCVLALSGLVWGVRQAVAATRARREKQAARRVSERGAPLSPYSGLLRWHHYAGLVFGLFAFTFLLSGLLSLDPWTWHPGTEPTPAQAAAVAGGPLRLDDVHVDRLLAAWAVLAQDVAPKELELVRFRGEPFLVAYRAPSRPEGRATPSYQPSSFLSPVVPLEKRLVSALHPERGVLDTFDERSLVDAARAAMSGAALEDAARLDRYDAYYYDRGGALPLPVVRARFVDPRRTWLYLDPATGSIVRKEETRTRLNRWLYRGLHSFDFPWLHRRRPLWDVVVIALCVGGFLLVATSITDGWRRVARLLRRNPRDRERE